MVIINGVEVAGERCYICGELISEREYGDLWMRFYNFHIRNCRRAFFREYLRRLLRRLQNQSSDIEVITID